MQTGHIVAGTYEYGVFVTHDNGQTWTQRNQGLGNQTVGALLFTEGFLFAGTEANAAWRRDINQIVSIENLSSEIPASFGLEQNYPNPFNPVTRFRYKIDDHRFVKLSVYDLSGKEVAVLLNGYQNPGTYEAEFDGTTFSSGAYFYRIESEGISETRKLILLK